MPRFRSASSWIVRARWTVRCGRRRLRSPAWWASLDPRDDVFLESFSDEARLLQPFTIDHSEVIDHLKFLHPLTHTALFDAVYMGLYEMRYASRDKRMLLVVTDGMDNRSSTSREEVIAVARAMKVLIYTIGIGDEGSRSGGARSVPDRDEVDMVTLRTLSDRHRRARFQSCQIGDGAQLARDCDTITGELIRQYTIAYLSPDPGRISFRYCMWTFPGIPSSRRESAKASRLSGQNEGGWRSSTSPHADLWSVEPVMVDGSPTV